MDKITPKSAVLADKSILIQRKGERFEGSISACEHGMGQSFLKKKKNCGLLKKKARRQADLIQREAC
jgi:hypothetical protein